MVVDELTTPAHAARRIRAEWTLSGPLDSLISLLEGFGAWVAYNRLLSSGYATLIGLETAAPELHVFEPLTVPGLLQTPDYARAVMRGGATDLSKDEIDRRVQVRLSRQAVLSGDDALKLWAILDEAVLTRQIGGPQVMAGQLTHLAELARRPGITIQVISFIEVLRALLWAAT